MDHFMVVMGFCGLIGWCLFNTCFMFQTREICRQAWKMQGVINDDLIRSGKNLMRSDKATNQRIDTLCQ